MTPLDFKSRKQTFLNELSTLRRNSSKSTERTQTAANSGDPMTSEAAKNRKEQWFQNYGGVSTRYLQQVHSINTIQGLARKLNEANCHHDNAILSFRTIDAIVKSCEKWKDYLSDQQSFDLLVCLEMLSMAKIHASVIAARNFRENQGALGVQLKDDVEIPFLFTTIVTYHGSLQVYS